MDNTLRIRGFQIVSADDYEANDLSFEERERILEEAFEQDLRDEQEARNLNAKLAASADAQGKAAADYRETKEGLRNVRANFTPTILAKMLA